MDLHAAALRVLELRCGPSVGRGDGSREHLADHLVEPGDLLGGDRRRPRERAHPRGVQDLVGVGVADPGDLALVAQQALDLLVAGGREGGEPLDGELLGERVDAERGDGRHVEWVGDDMHRQPLACAVLAEVEARAVVERDAQGQRGAAGAHRGLRGVLRPPQPPGPREVDEQVRTRRAQVDPFPVPACVDDACADQGVGGGGERLQRADLADPDGADLTADQPRRQEADEALHLGQLGHRPILPRPGARGQGRCGARAAHRGLRESARDGGHDVGAPALRR